MGSCVSSKSKASEVRERGLRGEDIYDSICSRGGSYVNSSDRISSRLAVYQGTSAYATIQNANDIAAEAQPYTASPSRTLSVHGVHDASSIYVPSCTPVTTSTNTSETLLQQFVTPDVQESSSPKESFYNNVIAAPIQVCCDYNNRNEFDPIQHSDDGAGEGLKNYLEHIGLCMGKTLEILQTFRDFRSNDSSAADENLHLNNRRLRKPPVPVPRNLQSTANTNPIDLSETTLKEYDCHNDDDDCDDYGDCGDSPQREMSQASNISYRFTNFVDNGGSEITAITREAFRSIDNLCSRNCHNRQFANIPLGVEKTFRWIFLTITTPPGESRLDSFQLAYSTNVQDFPTILDGWTLLFNAVLHCLPHRAKFDKAIYVLIKLPESTDTSQLRLLFSNTDLTERSNWTIVPEVEGNQGSFTDGASPPNKAVVLHERNELLLALHHFCMFAIIIDGKKEMVRKVKTSVYYKLVDASDAMILEIQVMMSCDEKTLYDYEERNRRNGFLETDGIVHEMLLFDIGGDVTVEAKDMVWTHFKDAYFLQQRKLSFQKHLLWNDGAVSDRFVICSSTAARTGVKSYFACRIHFHQMDRPENESLSFSISVNFQEPPSRPDRPERPIPRSRARDAGLEGSPPAARQPPTSPIFPQVVGPAPRRSDFRRPPIPETDVYNDVGVRNEILDDACVAAISTESSLDLQLREDENPPEIDRWNYLSRTVQFS